MVIRGLIYLHKQIYKTSPFYLWDYNLTKEGNFVNKMEEETFNKLIAEEKNVLIKTAKSNLNQIFVYKSEAHLHQKTVNINL